MTRPYYLPSLTALLSLHLVLLGISQCPPEDDADGDGWTESAGDCDDTDATIYPDAPEVCDGIDQDCDGEVDDGVLGTWYEDGDSDLYGSTQIEACDQPAGYVGTAGDCDDDDPTVFPGAAELLDCSDNDCDAMIDEGVAVRTWYLDLDGDGFGAEAQTVQDCSQPPDSTAARGDCDDDNAAMHPGAEEVLGDGNDSDCGGTDGGDPHVGLTAASYPTIQSALDAATDGQTVWAGPATYFEYELSFKGKAVALRSTEGAGSTIVNAQSLGTVVVFKDGEGEDTVMEGLTLTGGQASQNCNREGDCGELGGGVFILEASPSIQVNTVTGNSADYGGGLYMSSSSPALSQNSFIDNSASVTGGGIFLESSSPVLTLNSLSGNSASDGGGIALVSSSPTLSQNLLTRNAASYRGGGIFLESSSPTLMQNSLIGNSAYLGGGISLTSSSPALTQNIIADNSATTSGGAMALSDSHPTLVHNTVTGNIALSAGGGVYLDHSSSPTLTNNILAYNIGYNLYNSTLYPGNPTLAYNDLYSRTEFNHNLGSLPSSNLTSQPRFVAYSQGRAEADDDLHLAPGSPLIDAGEPGRFDPDGSASDVGAYGGAGADSSYYRDQDADGLYDAWETRYGLSTAADNSMTDRDGDLATDLQELEFSLDPTNGDTDDDGAGDGLELDSGADPSDWYSQPGIEGVAVARVPEDFPSVPDAVAAIQAEGSIEVAAGTYAGELVVEDQTVTLASIEGAEKTTLQGDGSRILTATWAEIDVRGFTVTGGDAYEGGGLWLASVKGNVSDCIITGNAASYGGGIYLYSSSPALTRNTISGNSADTYGGGAFLEDSSPALTQNTLSNNRSNDGGGIGIVGSSPTLTRNIITGNVANDSGGGIDMRGSSGILLTENEISGNSAGYGGGMYLYDSSPVLMQNLLAGNTATVAGGGVDLETSNPTLAYNTLTDNTAPYGAGLEIGDSAPVLAHNAILHNSALYAGGGIYTFNEAEPLITHNIIAYNVNFNVFNGPVYPANPTLAYNDLYASGPNNHNLETLDPSNLTVEPGFLEYSTDGIPTDLHLALASPLIDAGDPAAEADPDGSRADIGIYGGSGADDWDRDGDGYLDYFWPGALDDAPAGFDPDAWDADDQDPDVW